MKARSNEAKLARLLAVCRKLGTLIFFLGSISIGPSALAVDLARFLRLSPSVVKIEAFNTDGSISVGSGVMVGKGAVATNCHVTSRATRIDLIKGGLRWPAQTQSSNLDHDLCMLYSTYADVPVAAISDARLKTGQQVTAVGFVGGLGPRFAGGQIKALHGYDDGLVIQSSTPFNSGASGGGLFDEDGRLVGLATFKARRAGDDYHFSLPVKWIVEALTSADLHPIAPLAPDEPFWQRKAQPYFLRALAMEASGNWKALLDVSAEWTRAEPTNPHSWVSIGKAYIHLDQQEEAIAAYRKATAIDREDADAWFQLGLAFADKGEKNEVERVRTVLMDIDPNLAEKLPAVVIR